MLADRYRLTEWYFYGAKLLEQAANPCLLHRLIAPVAASVVNQMIIANNRSSDMR
jgi:hypothetical protein